MRNDKATPEEIIDGLRGRTITDVVVETDSGSWPQGDGEMSLVLDDGTTVEISSWGYDAWGVDVRFGEPEDHMSR